MQQFDKKVYLAIVIVFAFIFLLVQFIWRYFDRVGYKKMSDDEISINGVNIATWNIFVEI